jgi:CO dehydrogenase maturation factor
VVINQAREAPPEPVIDKLKKANLELIGTVPVDDRIYDFDFSGRPTIEMPEDSISVKAAFEIFDKIVA